MKNSMDEGLHTAVQENGSTEGSFEMNLENNQYGRGGEAHLLMGDFQTGLNHAAGTLSANSSQGVCHFASMGDARSGGLGALPNNTYKEGSQSKSVWNRPAFIPLPCREDLGDFSVGGDRIQLDAVDVQSTVKKFDLALVGRLFGKRIPFPFLNSELHKRWQGLGSFRLVTISRDCFICFFDNIESRNSVLLGGPWTVAGQVVGLDIWSPTFSPTSLNCFITPVWVRLPGLPLYCWSGMNVARIVAALGDPLWMDAATDRMERGQFARACVRIDLSQPLKAGIWIEGPYGSFYQKVEYEGLSSFCFKCGNVGHKEQACGVQGKHGVLLPENTCGKPPEQEIEVPRIPMVGHNVGSGIIPNNHNAVIANSGPVHDGHNMGTGPILDNPLVAKATSDPKHETSVEQVGSSTDDCRGFGPWMLVAARRRPPHSSPSTRVQPAVTSLLPCGGNRKWKGHGKFIAGNGLIPIHSTSHPGECSRGGMPTGNWKTKFSSLPPSSSLARGEHAKASMVPKTMSEPSGTLGAAPRLVFDLNGVKVFSQRDGRHGESNSELALSTPSLSSHGLVEHLPPSSLQASGVLTEADNVIQALSEARVTHGVEPQQVVGLIGAMASSQQDGRDAQNLSLHVQPPTPRTSHDDVDPLHTSSLQVTGESSQMCEHPGTHAVVPHQILGCNGINAPLLGDDRHAQPKAPLESYLEVAPHVINRRKSIDVDLFDWDFTPVTDKKPKSKKKKKKKSFSQASHMVTRSQVAPLVIPSSPPLLETSSNNGEQPTLDVVDCINLESTNLVNNKEQYINSRKVNIGFIQEIPPFNPILTRSRTKVLAPQENFLPGALPPETPARGAAPLTPAT